ncbi:hypothetical protein [Candidatus Parabeggiatoa sp. HSG14]|uniref:hypothetical protein n=1 Tax=Candidatus Parabeggiatoa sp. HSG14 TaxID=3055593 RepID=UPI0025A8931D|nr:hypothetical protein [Thiotrichales bacterium HSG14]
MTTPQLAKAEFSGYPKMSFAELLPIVQALPQPEKLQLIEILQEEVLEDISPLEHHKTYWIWTPINSYGTAEALMNAMSEDEKNGE